MKRYFNRTNKSGPYFEGWYFKCQTRDGRAIALIPAVHIREDGRKSASVQVITEVDSWWLEYSGSSFAASMDPLCIRVGGNSFAEDGLLLDVEREGAIPAWQGGLWAFSILEVGYYGPLPVAW